MESTDPAALWSCACFTWSSKCLWCCWVCVTVTDSCARAEVAWRPWHCPELSVCQYLSMSPLHFMAVTQSLGHHFCPWPLPCNSLTVSLCFIYSWRRCADESSISLNQKLRRTGPLLENISRYVLTAYYMPTFTIQFTVCNWIVTLAGLIIVFPLSYMWCK